MSTKKIKVRKAVSLSSGNSRIKDLIKTKDYKGRVNRGLFLWKRLRRALAVALVVYTELDTYNVAGIQSVTTALWVRKKSVSQKTRMVS